MSSLGRTLLLGVLAVVGGSGVQPGLPSKTALGAAVGRAIGAKNPDPKFRNPDYLAIRFLGPRERSLLADLPAGILDLDYDATIKQYPNPTFISAMLSRTRYFDERLDEALRGGARQIIILGAGLDSRGYRFKDLPRGVKFFEVDYGPTQEYKKQRVREIFGRLPDRIRYVAMDFAKDDLLTELGKYGYSPSEKTLFIWEAVVFYLPESAVKSTLHFVRDHSGPGSTIAFDYAFSRHPRMNNPNDPAARAGEPWIFGFPETGAAEFVRQEGLQVVRDELIPARDFGRCIGGVHERK